MVDDDFEAVHSKVKSASLLDAKAATREATEMLHRIKEAQYQGPANALAHKMAQIREIMEEDLSPEARVKFADELKRIKMADVVKDDPAQATERSRLQKSKIHTLIKLFRCSVRSSLRLTHRSAKQNSPMRNDSAQRNSRRRRTAKLLNPSVRDKANKFIIIIVQNACVIVLACDFISSTK